MAAESNDLEAMMKPFYHRASEAEERLARLEAALSGNKGLFQNTLETRNCLSQRMIFSQSQKIQNLSML